jgi:CRP-like cAMP-binding protein
MRKVLHLLGILSDVDLQWMAHHGVQQNLSGGQTLVSEGVPIPALYILLEGQLRILFAGMQRTIALLLPGEVIGEISFVDRYPPSASVVAIEDSLVLALPADTLRAKLAEDPGFASRFYWAVAAFLASRLRTTTRHLGYGSPQADQNAYQDVDELTDIDMEEVSLASMRFDRLLQQLRRDYTAAKV